MNPPRFHVPALAPGLVRLDDKGFRHAHKVKRLSVGDLVALFDGRGHEATGRIASATRTGVEVEIDKVVQRPRCRPRLTLAVGLPKGPRQDVLIEKCTELGVACIQPLITERSVSSASAHRIENGDKQRSKRPSSLDNAGCRN